VDLRVRFSETDANGHVSHVSYLIYCEDARTRLMEHPHIAYTWPRDRYHLVLAEQSIAYLAPAYFPERLHVATHVMRIGRTSLTLGHDITRRDAAQTGHEGSATAIARSRCTLVLVDAETHRAAPWPEELRRRLAALIDAP
jgi:acyl-CoA thioester hydrolase